MWVVLPGAEPTRARFFRFKMRLMTEDLPTLDRPAKAICGSRSRGQSDILAAERMNSAFCVFTRMVMFLPYAWVTAVCAGAASVGVAVRSSPCSAWASGGCSKAWASTWST